MADIISSTQLELLIALVGVVVWLVRLEGKLYSSIQANNQTQKDVDDLRNRHHDLDARVVRELTHIRESLARIEGRLMRGAED